MLRAMRKHAKYFYVLFVLVILTFIFWGVGGVDQPTSVPIASVGNEKISVEEYWRTYDRALSLAKEVYKEKFDAEMEKKLNLRRKVLDDLIEEHALAAAAEAEGIRVSDAEVEDAIVHDPTFQRNGAFNRDIYLKTLDINRLTPQAYESAKRRELVVRKMIRLVTDPVALSPYEFQALRGDEAIKKQLEDLLLDDKKEKALRSYIDGLKKSLEIKVNTDLIEG